MIAKAQQKSAVDVTNIWPHVVTVDPTDNKSNENGVLDEAAKWALILQRQKHEAIYWVKTEETGKS